MKKAFPWVLAGVLLGVVIWQQFQIWDLQDQVSMLQKQVAELQSKIAELESVIGKLKGCVSAPVDVVVGVAKGGAGLVAKAWDLVTFW